MKIISVYIRNFLNIRNGKSKEILIKSNNLSPFSYTVSRLAKAVIFLHSRKRFNRGVSAVFSVRESALVRDVRRDVRQGFCLGYGADRAGFVRLSPDGSENEGIVTRTRYDGVCNGGGFAKIPLWRCRVRRESVRSENTRIFDDVPIRVCGRIFTAATKRLAWRRNAGEQSLYGCVCAARQYAARKAVSDFDGRGGGGESDGYDPVRNFVCGDAPRGDGI